MAEGNARREHKKGGTALPDLSSGDLDIARDFHLWLLDLIDDGLASARRPPVMKVILALSLLAIYLDIFGSVVQVTVFTGDRVSALFACQSSEFSEVRSRARAM